MGDFGIKGRFVFSEIVYFEVVLRNQTFLVGIASAKDYVDVYLIFEDPFSCGHKSLNSFTTARGNPLVIPASYAPKSYF